MKIFLTGGTGFIGTQLVKRLAGTGHTITCLVRPTSQISTLKAQGAQLVTGDLTDAASLGRGMRGSDCVIHLASLYSFWESDRNVYQRVNVEGTRTLLESAVRSEVPKVVHISTAGIYGTPADSPFTENSPVGPVRFSEYFRTKYEAEVLAQDFHRKRGLPIVTVYPGAVLGPGDPKATGQYIHALINRRLPARVFEDSVMTFVHVKDVAEVIIRAAEKPGNIGEKYLAGKERWSFGQLNNMISEIAGIPLPRIRMPDYLAMTGARTLTAVAALTKKPPPMGMSVDQMKGMQAGFRFEGSKAERELGIIYTPIRQALEEAIASFRSER